MGRFIVRFWDGGIVRWAELASEPPVTRTDLIAVHALPVDARTTRELIEALNTTVGAAETVEIRADQLLSPVTDDAAIYAQGLNYHAHAAEASHGHRKSNLIFAKASSSLTGPFSDIVRPAEVELLDYEVEFGIVLRRDIGANDSISDQNLGNAVAGIVLCNDVSARDTMFGSAFLQWFRGKSFRTFCPTGPVLWLLDPNEVGQALQGLELKLWVNGEIRQQATSDDLIFRPAETIAYIAKSMDLRGGDLLLTGTPGGVTAVATPRVVEILKDHLLQDETRRDELRVEMVKGRAFLQPGDIVTATLTGADGKSLGGLANRIVDAG
ncbi:2-keto-4-pentenoate hydratase/2-oxohepta-3-ene-1,7-dioic acid hydratase in catechol pathway [Sphingobium xenophagum]|uniref:2-keto-4-pentenoate hydratase/2-oxohepta-3-ene-1,7-dioic acid hydratase in catechol pathway n=1 Tax=Sphingobium xenophagum TaxID=121428 RepID=A0ABU1X5D4_SPHXE|nr:fumarylacetoacetate hydrolase family protein [Sphingobium xenophagum]MDR7156689.1 2-keto-4-pentenoate hydratase/2-oxohepta-3-ene-1,7-dioic acid hydratase in catechol pathway [Sphingobium xenophagum]